MREKVKFRATEDALHQLVLIIMESMQAMVCDEDEQSGVQVTMFLDDLHDSLQLTSSDICNLLRDCSEWFRNFWQLRT